MAWMGMHGDIYAPKIGWAEYKKYRATLERTTRIRIDASSVKKIDEYAFQGCEQLREIEIGEGVEGIGCHALNRCRSLRIIKLPSSTKWTGHDAFNSCHGLVAVLIPEEGVESIDQNAFKNCVSLRNVALRPHVHLPLCFDGCHDLMMIFRTSTAIHSALWRRFEHRPVHKLCYNMPYFSIETTIGELRSLLPSCDISQGQDSLGMTPLHILACSRNENIELYEIIVDNLSDKILITEDKWGCVPLLYSIWIGASEEIIHFLVERHNLNYHSLDWDKMLETLCRAGVSIDTFKRFLSVYESFGPNQSIDLQKAAKEVTICLLLNSWQEILRYMRDSFSNCWFAMSKALQTIESGDVLTQQLNSVQKELFPDPDDINLQMICEELVGSMNGWWNANRMLFSRKSFQFLLKCNIPERVNAIGVRKWRLDIIALVEKLSTIPRGSDHNAYLDSIYSKVLFYELEYESLKNVTSVLELALWKAKIKESILLGEDAGAGLKPTCRVNSGADVIIGNVLQYLI